MKHGSRKPGNLITKGQTMVVFAESCMDFATEKDLVNEICQSDMDRHMLWYGRFTNFDSQRLRNPDNITNLQDTIKIPKI